MIYIIYAVYILFGVIVTIFINRKEERERAEIQKMLLDMIQQETPSWIASEYLSRIEKVSGEILSNRKPIDQIIVLWWGLDGLRLNDDGSIEWVSRRNQEPKNVYYVPAQYIDEPEPHYVAVSQEV